MSARGTALICLAAAHAQICAAEPPHHPAPELHSLAAAFGGRWTIDERYEPDISSPQGARGFGEELYRSGPGEFTFFEEVREHLPSGDSYGVAVTWWDASKGLRGLWCSSTFPFGCDLASATAESFRSKWDGHKWVIDFEFTREGKKFAWHEVYSEVTRNSFTQTAESGEVGLPLKRVYTIHAIRKHTGP